MYLPSGPKVIIYMTHYNKAFAGPVEPKSLYRSHAGSHFYGTEYEILADFGPVGYTEKKFGLIMKDFWGRVFQVFVGKKKCEVA